MVILLPDGVEREVPLEFMDVKDAVFIPTLKLTETKAVLRKVAKIIEIEVEIKNTIEDGYLGVMVWRTA